MTTFSSRAKYHTGLVLPEPDSEALGHSKQLTQRILYEIDAAGGWISFAQYMALALYTPGLGYYSAGASKLGQAGDFVTGPVLGDLLSRTLATQVAESLQAIGNEACVLELGAGNGRLALDLLLALAEKGTLPLHYCIIEVSAHFRSEQKALLEQHLPQEILMRVQWLDALPSVFNGVILANEVMDALPVQVLEYQAGQWLERGVTALNDVLQWQSQTSQNLAGKMADWIPLEYTETWPQKYTTEICPQASALLKSLAGVLAKGLILIIDYGFPAREYYHPQRSEGTLRCHYRHHAHDDPFYLPGLQDITSHVNFTALAEAGLDSGLNIAGYASQAQFLINCGLMELLAAENPEDVLRYAPLASQVQTLLSPAEMGELFKVIAFSKNFEFPLVGFTQGNKSHTL